jgi:short-subunit dehydrogenase
MKLKYRHIILTGASSGIGREMLDILIKKHEGTRIIAVARRVENIPALEGRVIPYPADLSKPEEIDALFSFAQERFGKIDVFIANAGFGYCEKIERPDWQHIERIFRLNFISPVYALEKLLAQPNRNNEAVCFASTCSVVGLIGLPGYALYSASKFALHGFMETYACEKPENLQITTVYPVAVTTKFFSKAGDEQTPVPWLRQKPKTVAKAMIRGIEKDKRTVYPSLIFRVLYPIGRAFPFFIRMILKRENKNFHRWIEKRIMNYEL